MIVPGRGRIALVAIFVCGAFIPLLGCTQDVQPPPSERSNVPATAFSGGSSDVPQTNNADPQAGDVPIASAVRVDAVAAEAISPNDELFSAWPVPKWVLIVTGNQQGYIEPCGCTGLDNQKGGLARRHTLLNHLASRNWPVLCVDVGNQVRRFGIQAEVKFQSTVSGLRNMDYGAVAFGPDDLRLSLGELIAAAAGQDEVSDLFVSANVNLLDLTPEFRTIRVADKRVGITSVLGESFHNRIQAEEIELLPSADSLRRVMADMQQDPCDFYILLAHASIEESQQYAREFPEFGIIVTAGGGSEPPFQPETVEGTETILVQVGEKGMHAGVVGFYDVPDQPLRYQRVPLDKRWTDSREMLDVLVDYQNQLEALSLNGLELKPISHNTGRTFVGSATCGECHTTAFEVWQGTPHAHATETLVEPPERYEIPRHHDPECLSCHVTGWDPQGYFPYKSGYVNLKQSTPLHGNGCENCHGPGSAHVAAENGDGDVTEAQLTELRGQMRLPFAKAERKCLVCHDLDNSPDFHVEGAFEKYWKQIVHEGKY